MAKDSYYVVTCKILAYLYKCLRDGSLPNMEILKARNYGINEVYFEIEKDEEYFKIAKQRIETAESCLF